MNKAKTLLGVIISIVFLVLAFKNVDIENVLAILNDMNVSLLAIPVMFVFLGLLQRALRWRSILEPIRREKVGNIFSVMMIGYLGNNVLPARMGEVLRIYALGKNYGFSNSQTFATIVLEKVFDVMILLLFFGIVLLYAPFPSYIKKGGAVIGFMLICAVSVLYLIAHRKKDASRDRAGLLMPKKVIVKVGEFLDNFQVGLEILKKRKDLFTVIIYSFSIWICEFVFVYLVMDLFDLNVGYLAAVFLTVMLNIGMLIPSSPGYIGTYQIICITALAPFGVQKEVALSVSIILQIITLAITTIIGFSCLWRENMRLTQITLRT